MRMPEVAQQVEPQTRRFHDGGVPATGSQPGVPPDLGEPPRIVLERHAVRGEEQFAMLRRIGYRDREYGEILVPADLERFRTDLTSVPAIFTWLVPKTGAHLPAALLHDGLLHRADEPATYVSVEGHQIDRVEADRVFRDAMADTGTGLVRRWLVWSAVTAATLVKGVNTGASAATMWRRRIVVLLTIAVVLLLGAAATLDLFDVAVALPWMGNRPWWQEVAGGLSGAVAIPMLLALAWGRFRMAGLVIGVGLAVMLHVTVGILLVTGLYWMAEKAAARSPMVALVIAAVTALAAAVTWVALSL